MTIRFTPEADAEVATKLKRGGSPRVSKGVRWHLRPP